MEPATTCQLPAAHWQLLISEQIGKGTSATTEAVRGQLGARYWVSSLTDDELGAFLKRLERDGLIDAIQDRVRSIRT